MRLEEATVIANLPCGGEYRELDLSCPATAEAVRPGQFVHVRVPRLEQAVLRRPFSVFKAGGGRLSVLYKTVGAGTRALAAVAAGERLSLLGPLGNGFPQPADGATPVLIAGGYGVAPLYFLATRLPAPGWLFVGGARQADVLCADAFAALGWNVRVTTDDGSLGSRGLVTAALDAWLAAERGAAAVEMFACGPDGMLAAVAERAVRTGCKAWLSLDKHMGCGVGACLACVQRLRDADGRVSWGRVCRDGPVFEARRIVW